MTQPTPKDFLTQSNITNKKPDGFLMSRQHGLKAASPHEERKEKQRRTTKEWQGRNFYIGARDAVFPRDYFLASSHKIQVK